MPGTLRPVGDLFDGYGASARGLTEEAFDEMVGHDGAARAPYATVASSLAQMGPEEHVRPRLPAGPGLHGPGRPRPRRRGAPVPPRRGAARPLHRRRVVQGRRRGGAAGARAGALPRRRVRSSADRQRRPRPTRGGHAAPPGLRAGGLRVHATERRAHPRGGGIDVIRDEDGEFPCARGQSAQPVGRELCAGGDPGRHGAGAARAVLGPAHSDGDRLPGPPHQRAAAGRAGIGAGPDGRGAHAGRAQLRLLRARAPGRA